MINPWTKYEEIDNKVTQTISSNPWDRYTSQEPEENVNVGLTASYRNTVNRVKNIGNIVGLGMKMLVGAEKTPEQEQLFESLRQGQLQVPEVMGIVKRDLGTLNDTFSETHNVKDTVKKLFGGIAGGVGSLASDPAGVLNKGARTLLEMPGAMLGSIVGDTFAAITGVALDGTNVRTYTPEEHAAKTKMFLGNAVAAAVAPAASKLIGAGLTAGMPAASALEGLSTVGLGKVMATPDKLGVIGRAIIDDAGAAIASGVTQGAIQNANTPEVLAGMGTALLFAPIGVLSGWYRGVTGRGDNFTATIEGAKEIKMLRDWQELSNANINGAAVKVEKLLTSDVIENALEIKPPANAVVGIDDLYGEFEKTLNDKDSFVSSLVSFTEKRNLGEHTNELLEKFATKFVEKNVDKVEIDNLRDMIKSNRESQKGPFSPDGETFDLLTEANKHGFFYTDEFGLLKIRDIETGDVVGTARNTQEALDFVRETGDPPNVTQLDSGIFPTSAIPSEPIAPVSNPHISDDFELFENNVNRRIAGFDLAVSPITAMNGFVEAIDRLNLDVKTDFKHLVFEPLEKATRLTNVAIHEDLNSGRMKLIDIFTRSKTNKVGFEGRFSPERLEQLGLAMETQSWEEMIAPNGYAKGYTIPQEAQDLARFMHENNIDATKVLYYYRASKAARSKASLVAEGKAAQNYKMNKVHFGDEQAGKIYDEDVKSFENDPNYQAIQAQIEGAFSPDANFMQALNGYQKLFNVPNGSAHAGAATRLKIALDSPDTHGLTQADFIKKHGLDADDVRLLRMVEEAYDHYGKKFGISDRRKFVRYMNHFRQYGDILDTFVVGDFERGIMDGAMREFASTMIRTGEIGNYALNPIANLQSYIRAGNKSLELYPKLTEILNNKDAIIKKELGKIQDSNMRQMIEERFNNYQRDISGRGSVSTEQALHIQANVLKGIILDENGKKMSAQDIINELKAGDKSDAVMALSSAGLLGGRVSLAMRDNLDVYNKFYIKHGSVRAGKLVKMRVSDKAIDDLVTRGDITRPSAQDVYNVVAAEGQVGAFNAAARELADFGFKTSLQGYYYMRNQAKVFLEVTQYTNKVLKEFGASKTMTKEKLYSDLFLNSYDVATQRMFDAFVSDGQFESASRLLATQDVRAFVGTFSRGNQAPVLNSKVGKFFGQLGSWSMTNRSVFENMMTRGTNKEIARSVLRYSSTIAATVAAGRATGFNLGKWIMLPTSFIATGGPAMSSLTALGGALIGAGGGNEAAEKYSQRQLQRAVTQFMPFSYLVQDVKKAADLASSGEGYGVMRPLGQATGIGVNTEKRNMLDIIQGNYPTAPEASPGIFETVKAGIVGPE